MVAATEHRAEPTESILRRFRAYIARAEHPNTPAPEAKLCREQAERLLMKYAITEAHRKVQSGPDPILGMDVDLGDRARIRSFLLTAVARAFGCDVIIRGTDRGIVYGTDADTDMIWVLYEHLRDQLDIELMGVAGRGQSYNRSFALTFISVVGERLKAHYTEEVAKAEAETPGTAVVLADNASRVQAEIAARHGRVRTSRTSDYYHNSAGDAAGQRADIFLPGARFGSGGDRAALSA